MDQSAINETKRPRLGKGGRHTQITGEDQSFTFDQVVDCLPRNPKEDCGPKDGSEVL